VADLLTHVLLAYAGCTILSWHRPIPTHWIAITMVGSILPDLNRITLIVTNRTFEAFLGVPFDIDALSTLGGTVLLAGIGSMVVTNQHRRTFAALLAGALSHHFIDGVKAYADSAAGTWLYPITWARHPTPSLYVSSDPAVLVAAVSITAIVIVTDRYVIQTK